VLSIIYGFGQFAAYDQFNKNLRLIKFFDKHSDVRHTISGGLGGAFGMALSTPFDVIRTRLIAQDEQRGYSSVYGACRHIYKHEGIRGLFRGLTPSIMQIAPLAAIQFGTYNFLVEKCISRFKIDSPPRVFILGAGLLSGIIAKTCVYPLDLTKKRLQIQQFQHNRQTFGQNITTNGMFDCIVQTVSKEGLLGLYKGLTPSIVKAGAMSGFYFFFYEEMRTILDKF
jgi:solute carrier family 25 thiamine pyrophosphate transporter 19